MQLYLTLICAWRLSQQQLIWGVQIYQGSTIISVKIVPGGLLFLIKMDCLEPFSGGPILL